MLRYFILTFLATLALATVGSTLSRSGQGTATTRASARSGYIVASS
jgi:hypothetical protein